MKREPETEFEGNVPSDQPSDRLGSRVMATFGGVLTISAMVILAIILLIAWLAR